MRDRFLLLPLTCAITSPAMLVNLSRQNSSSLASVQNVRHV
jgi:hypothetical protein